MGMDITEILPFKSPQPVPSPQPCHLTKLALPPPPSVATSYVVSEREDFVGADAIKLNHKAHRNPHNMLMQRWPSPS